MTTAITPTMTVFDLLEAYPQVARLFLNRKMACVGCSMSRFETLRDAAKIYRVDLDDFLEEVFQMVFGS